MTTYRPRHARPRRRWRPNLLLIVTAVIALAGASILSYSPAASWLSAYNQSLVVHNYSSSLKNVEPTVAEQLAEARRYNSDLSAGAVLEANANVPTGNGKSSSKTYDYWKMLNTPSGTMARIQIPKIGVDLPVYHGTSEDSLLRGAGHLQGTSLPVGGIGTHSVITAHRGLANAKMFTDLDQVTIGDKIIVTTFGQVYTYKIIDTRVVEPSDSTTLRQKAGKDLLTLVTCTPLGINTHRILVTGTRITPTPPKDKALAKDTRAVLQFPWWAVLYGAALLLVAVYVWWAGTSRRPFPAHEDTGSRRSKKSKNSEKQRHRKAH